MVERIHSSGFFACNITGGVPGILRVAVSAWRQTAGFAFKYPAREFRTYSSTTAALSCGTEPETRASNGNVWQATQCLSYVTGPIRA